MYLSGLTKVNGVVAMSYC